MIDLKRLNIEYKAAALFGAGSLFLSLILSIMSGNSTGSSFLRSLFFALIFCAIGYGSLYVMKRFVPEIYEVLNSGLSWPGSGTAAREEGMASEISGVPEPENSEAEAGADDKESPAAETTNNIESDTELGSINNTSHAAGAEKEYEKMFKYEPEIAAQAIRTMMKKDEK